MRTDRLAALSRPEAEALAGELVAALEGRGVFSLDGAETPAEALLGAVSAAGADGRDGRDGGDNGAAEAALLRAARSLREAVRTLKTAGAEDPGEAACFVPGAPAAGTPFPPVPTTPGTPAAGRSDAYAAAPGSAFAETAAAGQDMEGLSDYFRRDARRYDGGFVRY